jgi:NTP pyrophosphatase (non-canonical NTP hydrolase)
MSSLEPENTAQLASSPCAADTTIAELQKWVDRFAEDRDWERFHTPKNLAMSVAIEAAEIMELFQWVDGQAAMEKQAADSPVAEELADVLSYLLRLASVLQIDLVQAMALKTKKNAIKYPPLSQSVVDRTETKSNQ